MSGADFARLVALGAIWGASFIFQRVAAPMLGALWTSELRVLLAGLALVACACYGFNGVVMRKLAHGAPARGIAVGSQLFAALWIAPLLPFAPAHAAPTPLVLAAVVVLAILCSAVAYLLYFRLIADIGNTGALTVTYLVPIFGVLWGWLFLDEALTLAALAGGVLILAGVLLVTRR